MIITCIAYREDYTDTCRGCYMGSQSSDLQMMSSDDPVKIEDFVTERRVAELEDLGSYTFSYFIDGRPVDDGGQYIQSLFYEEYNYELYDEYERVIYSIKTEVDARMVIHKSELKAQKEAAERKKIEDAERIRKQNEIATLKALQARYPEVHNEISR